MTKTYGFQLRNGKTIQVEADGMHGPSPRLKPQGGTFVVRGAEIPPRPHHSDFDGITFSREERAALKPIRTPLNK